MPKVPTSDSDYLRCSFCHKSQDAAGKLISTPSDYPRAYICDECVAVCMTIIQHDDYLEGPARQDDRADVTEKSTFGAATQPHPLLEHPLASNRMQGVIDWVRQESLGQPALEQLDRIRHIASQMLR